MYFKSKCELCTIIIKQASFIIGGKCLCSRCIDWSNRLNNNCYKCKRKLPKTFNQRRDYGGLCEKCEKEFNETRCIYCYGLLEERAVGKGKYCSKSCYNKHYQESYRRLKPRKK